MGIDGLTDGAPIPETRGSAPAPTSNDDDLDRPIVAQDVAAWYPGGRVGARRHASGSGGDRIGTVRSPPAIGSG
jgi:hypothetical protein